MHDRRVRVRVATDDDIPAILDLLTESLGPRVPRTSEFWEWKHIANPFGRSYCRVAEAGGELAGVRCLLRWQWRFGDRTIRAVRAVDTVTKPAYRGAGIFTELTRTALTDIAAEGVAFVFNTPNKRSRPGYLKMGWRVGPAIVLHARLSGLRAIRSLVRGQREPPSIAGFPTVHDFLASPGSRELLQRFRSGMMDRFCTPRTPEYLSWRFGRVPGFAYGALWFLRKGAGALLIFRSRLRGPFAELSISELLLSPDPPGIRGAADLLRVLIGTAACDYVVASAEPDTPERQAVQIAGFRRLPRAAPRFTVLPLTPEFAAPVQTPSCWRRGIGDLEIF